MPRRTFIYDYEDVPSLEVRLQAQGGPQVDLAGTVDSGATRTALSVEHAELLGIAPADLRKANPVIIADGNEVASWTATVPIRGQVQNQASLQAPLEPWGPIIEFDPIFLEDGSPLWGQADFCRSFEVILQRYLDPARFVLDHWDSMSQGARPVNV
jgi:hypothetical protein